VGILKHLLFWPVTGPTFLARFAIDTVEDTVRRELTDDQAVKEDLLALQMRLELGEIDDEEYVAEEALLMQRLRDVRRWREEFGMGMAGGPVRVASGDRGSGPPPAPAPASAAPGPAAPPADPVEGQTGDQAESRTGAKTEGHTEGHTEGPRERGRGGLASPDGARVEIQLDWD
jgi:hypothetical protein